MFELKVDKLKCTEQQQQTEFNRGIKRKEIYKTFATLLSKTMSPTACNVKLK